MSPFPTSAPDRDPATTPLETASGLSGRLLVSMPQLDDGPFAQSVVLMVEHDEDHAFGIIVNKPIDGLVAKDAVAEVRLNPAVTAKNAPVFFGGPCEPRRGIILHTTEFAEEGTIGVGNGLAITATRTALERLHGDRLRPATSRLIAGHAGWGGGQLDDELRRHYWLDLEASAEFIFAEPPEKMWHTAIDRIGIAMSSLSALGTDHASGDRPLN